MLSFNGKNGIRLTDVSLCVRSYGFHSNLSHYSFISLVRPLPFCPSPYPSHHSLCLCKVLFDISAQIKRKSTCLPLISNWDKELNFMLEEKKMVPQSFIPDFVTFIAYSLGVCMCVCVCMRIVCVLCKHMYKMFITFMFHIDKLNCIFGETAPKCLSLFVKFCQYTHGCAWCKSANDWILPIILSWFRNFNMLA